jgi:hypothetical protein
MANTKVDEKQVPFASPPLTPDWPLTFTVYSKDPVKVTDAIVQKFPER